MQDTISIKSRVDLDLIRKVEDEYYQILLKQRLKFTDRWKAKTRLTRSVGFLRWLGLAISIVGVFLCLFYILYPSSCPKWFLVDVFLVIFILFGIFFYYLPVIESKMKVFGNKISENSCKKMAQRFLAKARKLVPYDVEYRIKDDQVSYFRDKDGNLTKVWNAQLKGYALLGQHTAVFFRKPTSYIPTMLIYFHDNQAIKPVLDELAINYQTLD